MAELISYTDIFKHILPGAVPDKQLQIIKDIETALASGADWCGDRIRFLRVSENQQADRSIVMPKSAVEAVVKLGLVEAYQQNKVSAWRIAAWLDNYNCLYELNDAVIQGMNNGIAASVWEHFLDTDTPLEPIEIDLNKIFEAAKESGGSNNK